MQYQHFTLPTVILVSCFFAQSVQGQFVNDPALWQNQFNQASAQISSARNYDLLRPIATRPNPSTNNGVRTAQSPFRPLETLATNPSAAGNSAASNKPATNRFTNNDAASSNVATNRFTNNNARGNNPVSNTKVAVKAALSPNKVLAPMVPASSRTVIKTLPITLGKSAPVVPPAAPRATVVEKQPYSINVTPHSFESGELDRYEFKIHNPAPYSLSQAHVKLSAPQGSRIARVVPKPKSVAGEEVVFEIGQLAPGGEQVVEVLIQNSRDELIQFESLIVSQTWGRNQIANNETQGTVAQEVVAQTKAVQRNPAPNNSMQSNSVQRSPVQRSPVLSNEIVNRELQLAPLAEAKLLEPLTLDTQTVADATRREPMEAQVPMDEVLQSEYEKMYAKNTQQDYDAFPLTPETASETKQFGRVASLLSGPTEVTVGEEVEYVVSLKNETTQTADSLIVQLSVPEDFKVTLLDRAAWYDAEAGKISWKVPVIAGQHAETIRYRGVARTAGLVKQGVVVGMDNELQGFCTFKTRVR